MLTLCQAEPNPNPRFRFSSSSSSTRIYFSICFAKIFLRLSKRLKNIVADVKSKDKHSIR